MRISIIQLRLLFAILVGLFAPSVLRAQTLDNNNVYLSVKYTLDPTAMTASASQTTNQYISKIDLPAVVYDRSGREFAVVAISSNAFAGCTSLEEINFGPNVKTIGSGAFANCRKLQNLVVPEGVEEIADDAFKDCSILRSIELPSTLKSLTSNSFNTNSSSLKSIRLNTANYDATGQIYGLVLNTKAFNTSVLNDPDCILYVPKKAEAWYRLQGVNGKASWGKYFKGDRTQVFGTAPTGYDVSPISPLADYRSLNDVQIQFNFADAQLTDNVKLLEGNDVVATLILADGAHIRVDASHITASGNTLHIDFSQILPLYKERFVARDENDLSTIVMLNLQGNILVEDCNFSLDEYFGNRHIAWNVPLLPSVFDLEKLPSVSYSVDADTEGHYSYTAFHPVTLTFDGWESVSLDSKTGANITATLLKDGTELCSVTTEAQAEGNTIVLPFDVPREAVLVRKAEGIDRYVFSLAIEGQVRLSDGKNYRFSMHPYPCTVNAEYYPEPESISYTPAEGMAQLEDLSAVTLEFEGLKEVQLLATNGAQPLTAQLRFEGKDLCTIDATKARVEANRLTLLFGSLSPELITLISSNKQLTYGFSLALSADILADGYPCRVQVGSLTPAADATSSATGTTVGITGSAASAADDLYTVSFNAPQWQVQAIVEDVPVVSVSTPLAGPNGPYEWPDLKTIVLTVENYKKLTTMATTADATSTVDGTTATAKTIAKILRYGDPVCVIDSIGCEGNQIILDFSNKLSYNAVGITPDDAADVPIALTVHFEGDLLFDGLPYHLVVDGYKEGVVWMLQPVVVYKLPAPTIDYADNHLYISCGVEGVEYHYTITNADDTMETTSVATKGKAGSNLLLPLQRCYEISVYASRPGYDDSDVVTAKLVLDTNPVITEKK